MHAMLFLSLTRTSQPAAFAWSKSWKRAVACVATEVSERGSPADAKLITVNAVAAATATAPRPSAIRKRFLRMKAPPSEVEMGVEDADLRDAVDREVVACGRLPDRLRARGVVDAERLRLVFAHVRVEPGNALVGIPLHHVEAQRRTLSSSADRMSAGERALHQVAMHRAPPLVRDPSRPSTLSPARARAHRPDCPGCRGGLPSFCAQGPESASADSGARQDPEVRPRSRPKRLDVRYEPRLWRRDAESNRLGARLAARTDRELSQDGSDVVVDGALRENEAVGDLGVPHALGDEREHLELARGQAGRVVPRRGPRPPRQPTRTAPAQPAGDERSRG